MTPSNKRYTILVDVKFSTDAFREDIAYYERDRIIRHIIGVSTQTHNSRGEYEEDYDEEEGEEGIRTYTYEYMEFGLNPLEDDAIEKFSVGYATLIIPTKLEHLKNNPIIEGFKIRVLIKPLIDYIELYKYIR